MLVVAVFTHIVLNSSTDTPTKRKKTSKAQGKENKPPEGDETSPKEDHKLKKKQHFVSNFLHVLVL